MKIFFFLKKSLSFKKSLLKITKVRFNSNKVVEPKELSEIDPRNIIKNVNLNRFTLESETENKKELLDINKEISQPALITSDKKLSRREFIIQIKKELEEKEKIAFTKRSYKMRVAFSLAIFMVGAFSLWVPLYRKICESQGYSVTTHQKKYIFAPEKNRIHKKFLVNFVHEVDCELDWEFKALQDSVIINAGETCLIFYRVRNKTDKPIVGLSVYDIHPQTLSLYFNKIQCFCFENQLLGPYEEVDLPVFFYIDPAVNDDVRIDEFREINLKYTFYMAKRQELAKIVEDHLNKNKIDQEDLKNRKIELNKQGKNYEINEDGNEKFSPLPGMNNISAQIYLEKNNI